MRNSLAAAAQTWKFIWRHPVSSRDRVGAAIRWVRWQLGSRLLSGEHVVPFANGSRLLVRRGMTGATGNIYTGLHEFEEMAFLLHFLRPDDLFVDVGANIGSYVVLASTTGATCVAFEPVPRTYADLTANIHLNGVRERVRAYQMGLGAAVGTLLFTSDLDTTNHVIAEQENARNTVEVRVSTLDEVLGEQNPVLIKLDVEGYESEVLSGATATLARPGLLALIVELNRSGDRYGFSEDALMRRLQEFGFLPYRYMPFERRLAESERLQSSSGGNTLFLRHADLVGARVAGGPRFSVLNLTV